MAKRWAKGVLRYEVKWADHGDEQNTWEPLSNLAGAEGCISDFEREWEKHYNAPSAAKRKRPTTSLEEAQREAEDSLHGTVYEVEALVEESSQSQSQPGLPPPAAGCECLASA